MNKKRITDGLTEARIQPCCRAKIYFFPTEYHVLVYFTHSGKKQNKKTNKTAILGEKNKGNRKSFLFYVCSMRWKKTHLGGKPSGKLDRRTGKKTS